MGSPLSLDVGERTLAVTNPDKVVFPDTGVTKLDLIEYYLAVADGALRGVSGRPMILKRFIKGITEEAVFQKRAPEKRPDWIDVAELKYASGTSAKEAVLHDAAGLAWAVNLGCVDLNPHPVLADDLEHPDELRVDLDPMPGVGWQQIVDVALVAREVLEDHGLTAWPKTSGSKGFHIYARIERHWPYKQVRLAAETIAREVELRAPDVATSRWWKEERGARVFVDFNQNAKDRTVASAYSVRATPDARVSTPLRWEEVPDCAPEAFTVSTVPARFAEMGDPWEGMNDAPGGLDALLERAKELGPAEKAPKGARRSEDGPRRRISAMPLIEIAKTKTKDEAMAALDVWRERYPAASERLEPVDVLVDGMRGPSSIWYRIRINLQHVPEEQRPPQEELIADYSPWENYTGSQWRR
ncbi:non-homologous end-joining DNA ligase [Mycobacterium sp. AZCC_0083]|uniref:non-homologous end-joining DNA ligase n=1 Tax=Mycobacterium sp. AZCC_0083 TaxID=2735882 RepID=UPI00160B25CC|nr:non-homologous end-joining DNA ligase [Mycobacterium sp. AZCC_0083]MBB5162144.1 DNA ligase D-like protein (predicted polymerase) [Mycobacterium sp. AZCC_0083]